MRRILLTFAYTCIALTLTALVILGASLLRSHTASNRPHDTHHARDGSALAPSLAGMTEGKRDDRVRQTENDSSSGSRLRSSPSAAANLRSGKLAKAPHARFADDPRAIDGDDGTEPSLDDASAWEVERQLVEAIDLARHERDTSISDSLIRISVGLEAAEDIIADLESAFKVF